MKVSSSLSSGSVTASAGRVQSGAQTSSPGFSASASQVGASSAVPGGISPLSGIEALLVVQEFPTPLMRRRKAVNRAGKILDQLDQIKLALLGGDLPVEALEQLGHIIHQAREDTSDPDLDVILDEIETRAVVELAKYERLQDMTRNDFKKPL